MENIAHRLKTIIDKFPHGAFVTFHVGAHTARLIFTEPLIFQGMLGAEIRNLNQVGATACTNARTLGLIRLVKILMAHISSFASSTRNMVLTFSSTINLDQVEMHISRAEVPVLVEFIAHVDEYKGITEGQADILRNIQTLGLEDKIIPLRQMWNLKSEMNELLRLDSEHCKGQPTSRLHRALFE